MSQYPLRQKIKMDKREFKPLELNSYFDVLSTHLRAQYLFTFVDVQNQ